MTIWDVVLLIAMLFALFDIVEARGRAFTSWGLILVCIVLLVR